MLIKNFAMSNFRNNRNFQTIKFSDISENWHHWFVSALYNDLPFLERDQARCCSPSFDIQDPLFVEFLEYSGTITSDMHRETLQSPRRSIKNKRIELVTESVVLLHDNVRLHVSSVTRETGQI